VATKIGQLAQELSRGNPWWRDARWARTDPDLSAVEETGLGYRSDVLTGLAPGQLCVLRGPRRVGKTVALKQHIEDLITDGVPPTSIVRVAADNMEAKELRTLGQNTALPVLPNGVQRTWLLDEISSVSGNWAKEIKWLRDNDPDFRLATVILTGSNARALTEAAGVLAGRRGKDRDYVNRTQLPIGFRTFARLVAHTDLPDTEQLDVAKLHGTAARSSYQDLIPWLDDLVRLWEQYISYGGFPLSVAAAANREPVPESFVEDLFDVIAGDAFKNSQLGANREMALLDRLWLSMASPANLSSIGQDVNVSHDVVARHVGYLGASFLSWACPQKENDSWLARERAQDKLYAIDPLVARIAHLRNSERQDIDPTVLTEMQIGMGIRRRILREVQSAHADEFLFHVRTPARKEIDFVSSHLAETAIEGKYTEGGSWRSDAATVNASQWKGILVTRNVLDVKDDQAWAVPAGVLAYLLDT